MSNKKNKLMRKIQDNLPTDHCEHIWYDEKNKISRYCEKHSQWVLSASRLTSKVNLCNEHLEVNKKNFQVLGLEVKIEPVEKLSALI